MFIGPGVETDGTPGPKVIGRLQFDFDPNAAEVLRVSPIPMDQPAEKGTPDQVSSMLTTVLASAKLHGPGVWNPVTHILSATVRIQNLATFDFDEPRMQVTWVNQPSVQFQLTHWGAGGVGSAWGYADIEAAPGANNQSAKQNIAIHNPQSLPFSFSGRRAGGHDPPDPGVTRRGRRPVQRRACYRGCGRRLRRHRCRPMPGGDGLLACFVRSGKLDAPRLL